MCDFNPQGDYLVTHVQLGERLPTMGIRVCPSQSIVGMIVFTILTFGCGSLPRRGNEVEFLAFYRKHEAALSAKYTNVEIVTADTVRNVSRTDILSGWLTSTHRFLKEFRVLIGNVNDEVIDNAAIMRAVAETPRFLYGTNPSYSFALARRAFDNSKENSKVWTLAGIETDQFVGPKHLTHATIGDPYRGFWFSEIGRNSRLTVNQFKEKQFRTGEPCFLLELEIDNNLGKIMGRYYLDRMDGRCIGCEIINPNAEIVSSYHIVYERPSNQEKYAGITRVDYYSPNSEGKLVLERRTHFVLVRPLNKAMIEQCFLEEHGFPEPPIYTANRNRVSQVFGIIMFVVLGVVVFRWSYPKITSMWKGDRRLLE